MIGGRVDLTRTVGTNSGICVSPLFLFSFVLLRDEVLAFLIYFLFNEK